MDKNVIKEGKRTWDQATQLLAQNYLHDRHSKRFSVVLNVRDYLEQRTETLIDLAEKRRLK